MNALAALLLSAALVQEVEATKPAPRDANWVKRHEGFVEIAKQGNIDLLLHGDSITDWWSLNDENKAMFEKYPAQPKR